MGKADFFLHSFAESIFLERQKTICQLREEFKMSEKQRTEDNMQAKPVDDSGEASEPNAVPSEPYVVKETDTEAGEEIVGKAETVTLDAKAHRKMKEQADKAAEHWDRLLRLQAEFENYKKRAARERDEKIKNANEALLESLVPALDNFDMAITAIEKSADSLKQGVDMVFKQLKKAILESGMEEIHTAVGQKFNPAWHEAVEYRESDEVSEGLVIEQIRKGYKLKGRLIRAAEVVVAKSKAVRLADGAGNPSAAEEASAEN